MEIINLNIKVELPFGNLFRKKSTLIAVINTDGKVLVGEDPTFYPEGISRMVGGGVEPGGETEIRAAARELKEEINIDAEVKDLVELFQMNVHAEDKQGVQYSTSIFVYSYKLKSNDYRPGDDVKNIIELTVDELSQLGSDFENLSNDNYYKGDEGYFSWADYGQVYGPIHKITAEKIK